MIYWLNEREKNQSKKGDSQKNWAFVTSFLKNVFKYVGIHF